MPRLALALGLEDEMDGTIFSLSSLLIDLLEMFQVVKW
uniref:Uncharacterized protein n=1 Tax=Arundo donax TaxID=35708 RepID=A0A0A9GYF7_ARUDO